MLDFEIFFRNHFADRNISDNKFSKFADIHLARLKSNNDGGVFTQIIADTTTAYSQYTAAISDEDIKYAQQQGLSVTVKKLLREFKLFTSRSEKLILGTLGKKSKTYQEFFPYGVSEYWQCSLKNVEQLMDRFVTAAGSHAAELGTDMLNKAQTLLTDFKNARVEQLRKKGAVADCKTVTKDKRRALEMQVMKNLYFIGLTYTFNINKCSEFFDQSFLRRKKKEKK